MSVQNIAIASPKNIQTTARPKAVSRSNRTAASNGYRNAATPKKMLNTVKVSSID